MKQDTLHINVIKIICAIYNTMRPLSVPRCPNLEKCQQLTSENNKRPTTCVYTCDEFKYV